MPLLHDASAQVRGILDRLGAPGMHIQVSETPDASLGDLATNAALAAAKILKRPPMQLAEEIAAELRKAARYTKVEIAAPGFVNITLAPEAKEAMLTRLAEEPLDAPTSQAHAGETVIFEVGSENVAKPMGVGHLRSNMIGMTCARLWRAAGATSIVINHLGDWGTQFGKLVVAYRKWGDEARVKERGIAELVELYQRFERESKEDPALDDEARATFRALEQGEPEVRSLWQRFVDLSLREYQSMYDRLGVKHDYFHGESFYEEKMQPILDELLARGIATENPDGSIGIEFPGKELPSTILRKSNGSTLYLTRDLATLKYRLEHFHPTHIFYFVGAEQGLHFRQVYRTAELLGWTFAAEHVPHGLVLAEGGKKMSTRKGTAVGATELFERAEEAARKVIEERGSDVAPEDQEKLVRDLATAALMYNDLSQNRTTTIVFDWEKMLAFEGDTAPYLLYAVARANSLEEKARAAGLAPGPIRIREPKEAALARELLLLHDRIISAAENLKPNLLAEQLFRIAQAFSSFYADLPVLNADDRETASSRLALALLARKLLRGGLDLLGIPRVDRM